MTDDLTPGTLLPDEYHPAADSAKAYVAKRLGAHPNIIEAMASCALSDNRQAEICSETISRLLASQPVSDRYLLGLAWTLKQMEEAEA